MSSSSLGRSSMTRLALVGALALPLAACTALTNFGSFHGGDGSDAGIDARVSTDDTGVDDDGGSPRDTGPTPDTGPRPDSGIPSECDPACERGEECCGGECVDLTLDVSNCGECGMVCADRDNSTPACDELGCDYDCEDGFDDCDLEESNGCEQQLNTASDCGSCDHACGGATPVCNGAIGTCVSGCTGSETNCDGTCVDVMGSDVTHCGSCTTICPMLPNTRRACDMGTCEYVCEGAFVDCNGDLGTSGSDGCETTNRLFYADGDGDGFGTGAGTLACAPPSGTSVMNGDCDDADALVYPGASESCDGVNEDCDANIDEGFSFMGLGVGAPCSCESGSATATVTCATAASATCRYPAEVCNGLDDDCDGLDDETFTCVRGSVSACTGSSGSGTCSYVGTQVCNDTCAPSSCMPPGELCDAVDQDCDGFVDEGAVMLRPPVGGFADGDFRTRVVAAAWRDATNGGAVLMFRDESGTGNVLSMRTFGNTGSPTGSTIRIASSTAVESAAGLGVFAPAAIAWDGSAWQVFYLSFGGTGGRVQRVSVSTAGVVSTPTAEGFNGATSVAAVRGTTGDVGVVIGNAALVHAGVWRAGAWATPPAGIMAGRMMLDYVQVSPIRGGAFVAISSDRASGAAQAIVARVFDAAATPASVYGYLNGGSVEIDVRAALESVSGRVVMTWRDQMTGAPSAGLLDTTTMSFVGSVASIGTSSNGPRVDAGGGEIYVGVAPDFRRLRPDTGAPYVEMFDGGWFPDAVVATPSTAGQRALTFGLWNAPINGIASRRFGCGP
ncbi:MAG: hypothetical protein J0L92_02420 [Deltaproteobacteria bacterium]|nr:hypothetical protein [Deltaproteobacteria bacterium]